jgi:hypothetical protein
MIHDLNVFDALDFSVDGRLFKLWAGRFFGTLFVSVLCVFYIFEKAGRFCAVFLKSCWSHHSCSIAAHCGMHL